MSFLFFFFFFFGYISLGISSFWYLFTLTFKKLSLHRTYTLLILYIERDTDQILLSNSFDKSRKCTHYFIFLVFLLRLSNLIFECFVVFFIPEWSILQSSSCTAACFPSHNPSSKGVQEFGHCYKSDNKPKTDSPLEFYTWTHQYWSTSKNSHSSALSGHWTPSWGPSKFDYWWALMMSECQRNPCCRHTLVMMMMKKQQLPHSWLIDFNGISIRLELFYTQKWGICVHCTFIFTLLWTCLLRVLLHTIEWYQVFLSNTNNWHTVVWFQVFPSNTNNFRTVLCFLVFLINANNSYAIQ